MELNIRFPLVQMRGMSGPVPLLPYMALCH